MGQTWKCNGDDKRTMPRWLWEKDLSILSNEEEMAKFKASAAAVRKTNAALKEVGAL